MCLFLWWQGPYDYYDWDQYRLILSDYETDEDYVNYCDELSKKIKVCITVTFFKNLKTMCSSLNFFIGNSLG